MKVDVVLMTEGSPAVTGWVPSRMLTPRLPVQYWLTLSGKASMGSASSREGP